MRRSWLSLLLSPWILVSVGNIAECGTLASKSTNSGVQDNLGDQITLSRERKIIVVNARDVVGSWGGENREKSEGYWQIYRNNKTNESKNYQYLGIDNSKEIIVIFVHGFNTPPNRGLANGNILWDRIMIANDHMSEAPSTAIPNERIAFITFLWRGDLGAVLFSAAQNAADVSSGSLANLILKLSKDHSAARIIIVAHSLGARVVLEMLNHISKVDDRSTIIDTLVLVQGAVSSTDIYYWTADDILSETDIVENHKGKYSDSIRRVRHFIYTVSDKDTILLDLFTLDEKWIPTKFGNTFLPDLPNYGQPETRRNALGSPFNLEDRLMGIPQTASPFKALPELLDNSRPIVNIPNLRDIKFVALYRFGNWKINHPKVTQLNISEGADETIDIEDWHSLIFDKRGLYVVKNIWKHVVDGF